MIGGSGNARYTCRDCGQPIHGNFVPLAIGVTLCEPCHARRQLRCSQCGAHDGVIAQHCTDGAYRCPSCLEHPEDVPAEAKPRGVAMVP